LIPNPKFHHATELKSSVYNSTSDAAVEKQDGLTTVNPVYEYSEEINAQAEKDFNGRRQHLWDICERNRLAGKLSPNAWEFFISPGHGIAWCNVFKAASTTWMYYMNILAGYDLKYLQRTVATPLELARKRFPRPSVEDLHEALENSISFLIVREPFERLLSAYRNKMEEGRNTYYKLLGDQIVKKFRLQPQKTVSCEAFLSHHIVTYSYL
jgi:chondroitin 4-sulfotransferase 11